MGEKSAANNLDRQRRERHLERGGKDRAHKKCRGRNVRRCIDTEREREIMRREK